MRKSSFKPVLFLLILSVYVNPCFSQPKIIEVSHYLFPEFTKGTILMKSGVRNEANLNYNSLTEEMIFDNNGTKLALDKKELIDTVYINDRKFFPLNKKFVELIYNSKYALYAEHKCKLIDPGKPAAYGGTSQTSATDSYSSFFSGGQVYQLSLPEGYKTNPFTEYWLKKDGNATKFLNLRQLAKLSGIREALFKEYVKKHDLKYDNQADIIELIKFMEAN